MKENLKNCIFTKQNGNMIVEMHYVGPFYYVNDNKSMDVKWF